jgi:hypothetical protein
MSIIDYVHDWRGFGLIKELKTGYSPLVRISRNISTNTPSGGSINDKYYMHAVFDTLASGWHLWSHSWVIFFRSSPFSGFFCREIHVQNDKFHHFAFFRCFWRLSKRTTTFKLRTWNPQKLFYYRNIKQTNEQIKPIEKPSEFFISLWFWASQKNFVDIKHSTNQVKTTNHL